MSTESGELDNLEHHLRQLHRGIVLYNFSGIIYYSLKWHEKYGRLTKDHKSIDTNEIIKPEIFELDDKLNLILSVVLRAHSCNVKQVHDTLFTKKDKNQYKKILRQVKVLAELGLVQYMGEPGEDETERIGNTNRYSLPIELTMAGIIYILINHSIEKFQIYDPFRQLLTNESLNNLFVCFLYPYFMRKTLLDLGMNDLFLSYLNQICRIINKNLNIYHKYMDPDLRSQFLISNRYTMIHLFNWSAQLSRDTQIDNSRIITILRNHLYREFKWKWLSGARFSFDLENNFIEIHGPNKEYSIIIISLSTETVTLRYRSVTYSNIFKMKRFHDQVSIYGKNKTIKEGLDIPFLYQCKRELCPLLFELQHIASTDKRVKHVLNRDPKFKKTLNEIIEILKFEH